MLFNWFLCGRLEHPASKPWREERVDGTPRERTDSRAGDDTRTPTQRQRTGTHHTIIHTHRDNHTGKRERIDHNPQAIERQATKSQDKAGRLLLLYLYPYTLYKPIHIDHIPIDLQTYKEAHGRTPHHHAKHTSTSRERQGNKRGKSKCKAVLSLVKR